jgi:hypothetical protein
MNATGRGSNVEDFDDAVNTALDDILRRARFQIPGLAGYVTDIATRGPERVDTSGSMIYWLNFLEWQILHVADISVLADLTRRRIRANPDRITEIINEATQMLKWYGRRASQGPSHSGPFAMQPIAADGGPEERWANLLETVARYRAEFGDPQDGYPV